MLFRSVIQKASKWTLFAFTAFSFLTAPLYAASSCSVEAFHEIVHVASVYDGDTIKLTDGRKIRLIGINTPERGRDGKHDEPFYLEAKNKLQQIIKNSNNQVKLVFGNEKHDRYQRVLAHIFTPYNENITATLIKNGLGFTISIPPNLHLLNCYQDAERFAQKQKAGIWNHQYSQTINVSSLSSSERGFHRVTGQVDRIGESRTSFWLNLNSKSGAKFALRILKKDISYFKDIHPKDLINHQVSARGWIYTIKGEQRMTINHPAALQ